jgi:hypothetical protein
LRDGGRIASLGSRRSCAVPQEECVPGVTKTKVGCAAVWLALTGVGLSRAAGAPTSQAASFFCGAVGTPVALVIAAVTGLAYWRGPTIVNFRREESVECAPDEAAYIRLASRLRGTMGGAGFLYPRRLLFPVLAWTLASAEGVALMFRGAEEEVLPWLAIAASSAAAFALFFPARPFYYLEATGGKIVLSPTSIGSRLRQRAIIANAIAAGTVDSATPRESPIPSA